MKPATKREGSPILMFLNDEQKRKVRQAAGLVDMPMSRFCLDAALERASKLLEAQARHNSKINQENLTV